MVRMDLASQQTSHPQTTPGSATGCLQFCNQHQLCTAHPLFLVGYHFVHSFCPPCFPSHRTIRMLCTTFFCSAPTNVRSYFYIASSPSVLRHDQSRNLLAHQQLRKKKRKKKKNQTPPTPASQRSKSKKTQKKRKADKKQRAPIMHVSSQSKKRKKDTNPTAATTGSYRKRKKEKAVGRKKKCVRERSDKDKTGQNPPATPHPITNIILHLFFSDSCLSLFFFPSLPVMW
jgi:hypothetical protein